MTNINQASENESKKIIAVKKNIAHRFIMSNARTPFRIRQDQTNSLEDLILLTIEGAYNLIEQQGNHCTYRFIEKNKAYLTIAEKKLGELSSYSTNYSDLNLIEQMGKPCSELIKIMEENEKPLLCVDVSIANLACMLVDARIQNSLLVKFWKDLPNGAEQLRLSDNHFEELCSGLKIGRRTRAIINNKKSGEIA